MTDDSRATTEDGGVLGNLPRTRPGRRSQKRATDTAARAATRAERSGSRAAKAPPTPKPRAPHRPGPPPQSDAGGDPVSGAIRLVAGVAATGARLTQDVAREVLRRLPRP
jgi:hypothetical protein